MTTKEIMQRATSETIVRMPVGLQGEEGIVGLFSFGTFFTAHRTKESEKKRDNEMTPPPVKPALRSRNRIQIGHVLATNGTTSNPTPSFVLFALSSLDLFYRPRPTISRPP